MNGSIERLELDLAEPFGIARGTTRTVETVVLRLEHDGDTGLGAATPSPYYGETGDTVLAVLPDLLGRAESIADPHNHQRVHGELAGVVNGNSAAKAAVDIARYDLACRALDVPLYRYLGLDPDRAVPTSFTISLAGPSEMATSAEAAVDAGHQHLKVKLGGDDDAAIISQVREAVPDASIRVDANGGWSVPQAVHLIEVCADHGVEFVEQPVPAGNPRDLRAVRAQASIPVAADESCVSAADVPGVAEAVDIVNVKLMKCGGIRPALVQIATARAHGLDVMLGCMLESNASIAAAAHLTPLVDYADLDGSLLLADDPFDGVPMPACDLHHVEQRGTGAVAR